MNKRYMRSCQLMNSLKVIEEQLVANDTIYSAKAEPVPALESITDRCYIGWLIFDEIVERVYTIECKSYVYKKENLLNNEELN